MKYYAVTEDPRELYHYGVKGMKWGQHIFGDKPKSPGYHKAVKKLKSIVAKASASSAQAAYNRRAAQQNTFNKRVAKQDQKMAKLDAKIDNYFAQKPIKDAQRQLAISTAKHNIANAIRSIGSAAKSVGNAAKKVPGQVTYNVRRHEEQKFQKAVQKAQDRNRLTDALHSLDKEDKFRKQVDRDRKMEELREKQSDIMADNDLKTLQKAVKVEKNLPKYFQEARTGTLKYGKLSDEQIGRLQNRLALEAQTRRLGSTEEPSWRQQKKLARREGYLQGITRGTSAAMEEVAKAGVQYGIKNLANRKKLDKASEYKAQREHDANRIKNQKSHKEIREDFKNEAYEAQVRAGVRSIQRGALSTREAAKQLRFAENKNRERQNAITEANEERKFLMEEKRNAVRNERQRQERLTEASDDMDRIGKDLHEHGYAIVPSYNKDGKRTGVKILTDDGRNAQIDKNGKVTSSDDGPAYLKLYRSKYNLPDKNSSKNEERRSGEWKPMESRDKAIAEMADEKRLAQLQKEREEHEAKVDKANEAHLASEKRRQELAAQAARALAKEAEDEARAKLENEKRFQAFLDMREDRNERLINDAKKNREATNTMKSGQRKVQQKPINFRVSLNDEDIFGNRKVKSGPWAVYDAVQETSKRRPKRKSNK